MLVLIGKQVETEFKLEEKFRELCEEVSIIVKEREDMVEELERLSGNHMAKEIARLLRRSSILDNSKRGAEDSINRALCEERLYPVLAASPPFHLRQFHKCVVVRNSDCMQKYMK
nr:sialyltransferase-like protein 1 [Tanacetum cinerariifolium]